MHAPLNRPVPPGKLLAAQHSACCCRPLDRVAHEGVDETVGAHRPGRVRVGRPWWPWGRRHGWISLPVSVGPTASGCCSTSSTLPVRSPRHAWTGSSRRPASRKGRRCPRGRATGRSPTRSTCGSRRRAPGRSAAEPRPGAPGRSGRASGCSTAAATPTRPRSPRSPGGWDTCTWTSPGAGSGPSAGGASRPRPWSTSAPRPRWPWSGSGRRWTAGATASRPWPPSNSIPSATARIGGVASAAAVACAW